MKFVVGRSNLACTIFVPFDCDNNCPFCTSKKMYKNIELRPDRIIEKILMVNHNPDVTEYVLTGGEPFANLDEAKRLIDAMNKKVFINTTLPLVKNIDEVIEYINSEPKIKGINVSRHIGYTFSGVADLSLIECIKKPIRINTVINKHFTFDAFKKFVKEWGSDNRMINLRADYTKLDTTTLKSRDAIEELLSEEYRYDGAGGCLVCHSSRFEADNCYVQYHRGLMFSSVKFGEKTYVNDVIITPDGNIYKDWDFKADKEFDNWALKLPDIKETQICVVVDWLGNGEQKVYYCENVGKNYNVVLTKDRALAKTIYNKEQLEGIQNAIKKELKEHLVSIQLI